MLWAQLRVRGGLATGMKNKTHALVVSRGWLTTWTTTSPVVSRRGACTWDNYETTCQLRVKGRLTTGMKQAMGLVASQGWTCNWDEKQKHMLQLRVEGGLASLTIMSSVASRGWTCN